MDFLFLRSSPDSIPVVDSRVVFVPTLPEFVSHDLSPATMIRSCLSDGRFPRSYRSRKIFPCTGFSTIPYPGYYRHLPGIYQTPMWGTKQAHLCRMAKAHLKEASHIQANCKCWRRGRLVWTVKDIHAMPLARIACWYGTACVSSGNVLDHV
jgi:hypothetical protein